MIKILKNKFLICLFLLVTVFSVTSSCFAVVYNSAHYIDYTNPKNGNIHRVSCDVPFYLKPEVSGSYTFWSPFDFNDNPVGVSLYINGRDNYNGKVFTSQVLDYPTNIGANIEDTSFTGGGEVCIYDIDGSILFTTIPTAPVEVSHEFQSDTSAKVTFTINNAPEGAILKYSLSGIKLNMDLTAPLELENPVIYSPGVTNLVVKPNTKVYWALYDTDGSCLLSDVYQVPEYNVQVENANKSIEYKLEYSKDYTYAVLTASLKNGEFSDKLVYSEFSALNISTGKLEHGYQNFYGSLKITTNGKYYFYALDSFGNVFKTVIITVSDIFNFVDSDFSYTLKDESTLHGGYKLHITPKVNNWSSKVDIKYTIKLTAGHQFATVTIPTEYPELSYVDNIFGSYGDDISPGAPTYFNGRVMSGDSIRVFSPSNNLEDLKGEITFKIYKKSDNSLIFEESYTLNVNAFTAGNTTDGTAGDVTGTLPEDSENSEDFTDNDYGDVSWSDVEDYVGTSGSFWSIVKNILNNLPKWITAPIFFFISAVVAIALIKAILP